MVEPYKDTIAGITIFVYFLLEKVCVAMLVHLGRVSSPPSLPQPRTDWVAIVTMLSQFMLSKLEQFWNVPAPSTVQVDGRIAVLRLVQFLNVPFEAVVGLYVVVNVERERSSVTRAEQPENAV